MTVHLGRVRVAWRVRQVSSCWLTAGCSFAHCQATDEPSRLPAWLLFPFIADLAVHGLPGIHAERLKRGQGWAPGEWFSARLLVGELSGETWDVHLALSLFDQVVRDVPASGKGLAVASAQHLMVAESLAQEAARDCFLLVRMWLTDSAIRTRPASLS